MRDWKTQEITQLSAARDFILGQHPKLKHPYRPPVPLDLPPALSDLMQRCWAYECWARPSFEEIVEILDEVQAQGLVDPMAMPFKLFSDQS
jgi:hypothetical protein